MIYGGRCQGCRPTNDVAFLLPDVEQGGTGSMVETAGDFGRNEEESIWKSCRRGNIEKTFACCPEAPEGYADGK